MHCNSRPQPKAMEPGALEKDSEIVYEEDSGLVSRQYKLSMYGKPYTLSITIENDKDSSVAYEESVVSNSGKKIKCVHRFNNHEGIISFEKGDTDGYFDDEEFERNILKGNFKEGLGKELYKRTLLTSISYDNARTNRLYFIANFKVIGKDSTFSIPFTVFYKTKKIGEFDYWGIDKKCTDFCEQ